MLSLQPVAWDKSLVDRYNITGPRYTSYPTALEFSEDQADTIVDQAYSSVKRGQPISLYIHIPFCRSLCYYCACNKIITKKNVATQLYLEVLLHELDCAAARLNSKNLVQVHWGGGTPNYLSLEQIAQVHDRIEQHFGSLSKRDDEGKPLIEVSVELDPRLTSPEQLEHFAQLGFNRLSIGVQDLNAAVQKAVNRVQPREEIEALVQRARTLSFDSISMDLIYGLPLQTAESFEETLHQIVKLGPDRLSVFNYAHLPHRFFAQRKIREEDLPSPEVKLKILQETIQTLQESGYLYLGMDHFAKPGDSLADAFHSGAMHRNFQGYTTRGDCALIGLGVSAISDINGHYLQNQKDMEPYQQAIHESGSAVWRGYAMDEDDKVRRAVIMTLLCCFEVSFAEIEHMFGIQFEEYFDQELASLAPMVADGLVEVAGNRIEVSPAGRLFIRNICMNFDAFLGPRRWQNKEIPVFSRVV